MNYEEFMAAGIKAQGGDGAYLRGMYSEELAISLLIVKSQAARIAALEGTIEAHNADQANECESQCGGEILLCPTCPMKYIITMPAAESVPAPIGE